MKKLILMSTFICFSLHALEWHYSRAIDKGYKEQWPEAGKELRSLLVDHPTNPELLYDNGVTRFKEKQFSQAAAYFEHAIHCNPEKKLLEQIHFNLGNSYVELEKLPQALEQYEKTLEINPENEQARHNRDIVKQMMEEEEKQKEQEEQQQQEQEQEQNKQDQQQQNNQQNKNQSQDNQNQSGNDQSPNQNREQQDQQGKNPQDGDQNGQDQPSSAEKPQDQNKPQSDRNSEPQKQRDNPQQHGNDQQRADKGNREQRSHDQRGDERNNKEHTKKELEEKEQGNNAHNDQQAHNNPHQSKSGSAQQGQHRKDSTEEQANVAGAQSADENPYLDKDNPRDQQLASLLQQCEDADEKANKRFMKALMRKEGNNHESQPGW